VKAHSPTTRSSVTRKRHLAEIALHYSIMAAGGCVAVQFAPPDWFVTMAAGGGILMGAAAKIASVEHVTALQDFARWPLLPATAVTGAPSAVAAVIGRRHRRQVARVAEAVAAAMHATSSQAAILDVRIKRSWLGRPAAITIGHPPAINTTDPKVAMAMQDAVTRVIGGRWQSHPEPLKDRTTLRRLPDGDLTDSADELDGPVARVTALFRTSLGPDVTVRDPKLGETGDLQSFHLDYKPRLAVAVPAFRARLDNHLSQLLPGRWVGAWDLQNDTVAFSRRPELDRKLPFPLDDVLEAAASARYQFMLEVCQTVNGDVARWNLNGKVPHALFAGETGGGKTVAEIVAALAGLLRGFRVRIADPKRIEFLQLEQWPGVVQIAKTPEDIVDLIERVFALQERRYSQIERREIRKEDLVPELVILDEWFVLRQRLNALWRAGGEDGKPRRGEHPALGLVGELLALARAARIHILLGIQRPDATNFPAGARDNARFRLSLGRLSSEGATMMWDSPYIGTDIPDDIPGRGTVRAAEGPVEAHVYWLPNLDLHVPDTELSEQDAECRRRLLAAVTAAQHVGSSPTSAASSSVAASTASSTTASAATSAAAAGDEPEEQYEVVGSLAFGDLEPGQWIVVDDPELDGRQVAALVETVDDGDEDEIVTIAFVTAGGATGVVDVDRGEYVDLVSDPTE
jgi:S-DNA-T family DNA segregation ATPase FtsK/SpoIIIE